MPDDPKPSGSQRNKATAERKSLYQQVRELADESLARFEKKPTETKMQPVVESTGVPTARIPLSPSRKDTAMPRKHGFVRYYWTCLKHLGSRVWETKGTELVSAIVLAFAAFGASLLFSEEGANRAFEIALVSLAGWLAVFALGHLIRTPWLVHSDTEAAIKIHPGFGMLGVAVVVLMAAGVVAGGLRVHSMLEPRIIFPSLKFPSADMGAKDAQIKQLTQQLGIRRKPAQKLHAGPPQVATDKQAIAAGLQQIYDNGQKLREALFNSDDNLNTEESQKQFAAWRLELRTYITQHVSVGKSQYVDGIASVTSMSYSGMKSVNTRETKELLISHINARMARLSELMKEY